MVTFDIDGLIKEATNGSQVKFCNDTGLSKNIPTIWKKRDSEATVPLHCILDIARAYPHIDLKKYFPMVAELFEILERQDMLKNQ